MKSKTFSSCLWAEMMSIFAKMEYLHITSHFQHFYMVSKHEQYQHYKYNNKEG